MTHWRVTLTKAFLSVSVGVMLLATGADWSLGNPVLAQSPPPNVVSWSEPFNVSHSPGDSSDPVMVADRTGLVHLFWSERSGEEVTGTGLRAHGNAIVYGRWMAGEWTEPNDVLVSPDGGEIWQPVVAVDDVGILHLLWASEPGGRLYYSQARVAESLSAQGWTAPVTLFSGLPTAVLPAAIAVDSQGVIHVIYSSRDSGQEVAHIASTDGGRSWSYPTSLSFVMPILREDSLVSGGVAFTIDKMDHLHAGWSMYNREGFGVVVYYTQSVDGGMSWRAPLIVGEKAETDYEADWLNIATVGEGQIFLVWTGIGRPPGRIYRTSSDRGLTWTPATPFMEGLVGETESPRMVVDGAGVVHLFTPARTVTADSGVRYSYWTGQNWGEPVKIPGPPPDPGAYPALRVTAAVSQGNRIWVAWYDEPKGEIFVTHGDSGAPILDPLPFSSAPNMGEQPALSAQTTPEPGQSTSTPPPQPTRVQFDMVTSSPANSQTSSMDMLIVSVIPSVLVVTVIVGLFVSKRRR